MKTKQFDRFTLQRSKYGEGWDLYGWSTYPASSALAGQPLKRWLDSYETLEAGQAAYPEAQLSSPWIEQQVSLAHLPGPDDPVPGGMYPDDI